jgi:hypothetical protein
MPASRFIGMLGLTVVGLSTLAAEDTFTFADIKVSQFNSVTSAGQVEGGGSVHVTECVAFAVGPDYKWHAMPRPGKANPSMDFDPSRTVGRLLHGGGEALNGKALAASFPETRGDYGRANRDRVTIELDWSGAGVENLPGPDFVVFEAGPFEPFAVSVKVRGSNRFTEPRYQFASTCDPANNVNAVLFDLSDFRLPEGEVITAIRIRNVFNLHARAGADKVDNPRGEGRIIYPSDWDYAYGFMLRRELGGQEFEDDELDADIVYVAALHNVISPAHAANARTTPRVTTVERGETSTPFPPTQDKSVTVPSREMAERPKSGVPTRRLALFPFTLGGIEPRRR